MLKLYIEVESKNLDHIKNDWNERKFIERQEIEDILIEGEDTFDRPISEYPIDLSSIVEAIQEQAETDFIYSDVRWNVTRTWTAEGRLNELVVRFDHHLLDDIHVATIHTEDEEFVAEDLLESVSDNKDFHILAENTELYVNNEFEVESIGTKTELSISERFSGLIGLIFPILMSPFGISSGGLMFVITQYTELFDVSVLSNLVFFYGFLMSFVIYSMISATEFPEKAGQYIVVCLVLTPLYLLIPIVDKASTKASNKYQLDNLEFES